MSYIPYPSSYILSVKCEGAAIENQEASQIGERPVRISDNKAVNVGESVSIIPIRKLPKNQKFTEKKMETFPMD